MFLKADNGSILSDSGDISDEFLRHFRSILAPPGEMSFYLPSLSVLMGRLARIPYMLTSTITMEELQHALFSMAPNKAPGPDGFTATFFWHEFHTVARDLLDSIRWCLDHEYFPRFLASTAIRLIPKALTADTPSMYRSISCCSVMHKLASKILSFRH